MNVGQKGQTVPDIPAIFPTIFHATWGINRLTLSSNLDHDSVTGRQLMLSCSVRRDRDRGAELLSN